MSYDVIAIDGPAASGKSTVARGVAHALGRLYLDSGALYRGVTWQALERGTPVADSTALLALMEGITVTQAAEAGMICFLIDGQPLGMEIRAPRVDAQVSVVAATPSVRQAVAGWLRQAAALGALVSEGRDIGTVVFPDAPYKFYLDASPEERARRRFGELSGRAESMSLEDVARALRQRDTMDRDRQVDPLRVAPGAIVIDTTGLSVDEVVHRVASRVRESHA